MDENKNLNQNIILKDNLIQRLLKEKSIKDEENNKLNKSLYEKEQKIQNQIQINQDLNTIIIQNKIKIMNLENEKINLNNQINQMKQINNQINNNFHVFPNPVILQNIQFQSQIIPKKRKIGKILSKWSKTPEKGLVNIGSTCYMNATLQCFSQTVQLTEYFLDPSHKNIIVTGQFNLSNSGLRLAKEYYNVVTNLWNINGIKYYEPKQFKYVLGRMNTLFEKMEASDAKDMIVFFLEQIHKEINLINVPKTSASNSKLNQYNREETLQYFFNEFQKTSKSVISDHFFVITETTQKCQNCKSHNIPNYICYNYNIQNCFYFPLEEIRKYKNNKLNNNNMNPMITSMGMSMNPMMIGMNRLMMGMNMGQFQNELTLDDCFDFNEKEELMTGQNQIYCNLCHQNSDSIYGNKILGLPNILIMILNRGKGNIYKVDLNFPTDINLTKYVLNAQEQYNYSVYGVITHLGGNGESGHFIASCKSPIDNQWYKYNDSIVTKITDFNKEVLKFGTPYILFYEKN